MALINCPECGMEISDKATACPHCGNSLVSKDVLPELNQVDEIKQVSACKDICVTPLYAKVFLLIGIILIVLGLILINTNPTEISHKKEIEKHIIDVCSKAGVEDDDFKTIIINSTNDNLKFKTYWFYSTTEIGGTVISKGFLGNVEISEGANEINYIREEYNRWKKIQLEEEENNKIKENHEHIFLSEESVIFDFDWPVYVNDCNVQKIKNEACRFFFEQSDVNIYQTFRQIVKDNITEEDFKDKEYTFRKDIIKGRFIQYKCTKFIDNIIGCRERNTVELYIVFDTRNSEVLKDEDIFNKEKKNEIDGILYKRMKQLEWVPFDDNLTESDLYNTIQSIGMREEGIVLNFGWYNFRQDDNINELVIPYHELMDVFTNSFKEGLKL